MSNSTADARASPSLVTNNVVLKSSLNSYQGLNISFLNTRSIFPKIDEIRCLIHEVKLDVLCFVETWLSDRIPDSSIFIPGFNVLRLDRKLDNSKRGGGICVYLNSTIKFKIIDQHCAPNLEAFLIELMLATTKILLIVIYKPPRKKFCDDLKVIFENYSVEYNDIVVCGDFNCDRKVLTTNTKQLLSLLNKFCLKPINDEPTCFTKDSCSLLDWIITNTDKMVFINQISVGFTDHDLIYCSYDVNHNIIPQTFTFRDFTKLDIPELISECDKLNWSMLYYITNPTVKADYLTYLIKKLYDRYVPLRTVVIKQRNPPWFNDRISSMINFRNFIYRRWKFSKNILLYQEYRTIRNKVTNAIKHAKMKYFSSILNPSLPSKVFWKNLKSVGLSPIGNKKAAAAFSPNDFNKFFSGDGADNAESLNDEIINTFPVECSFSFKNIDIGELTDAFDSVKSNATGVDGIPIKFVKLLLPNIDCYLLHVFNSLITFSTFPSAWKQSIIVPFPKKKNPTSLSDFRPISLLPALSKVFEKILQTQILLHVESQNLLSIYQSAYRRNHSTNTALLHICDDMRRAMDNGNICSLVLLDFSKAFDKIDHSMLIRKLHRNFKFSLPACRLISAYLHGRSQLVKFDSEVSDIRSTFHGVPQGSVLGPFLFLMFINDLSSVILFSNYHFFADDLQIYKFSSPKDISNCIARVNSDIQSITQWSLDNKLELNSGKTQSIIISPTNRSYDNIPKIHVKGVDINFSDTVNNLGLVLDKTLCWNFHTEAICNRVVSMLRMLWTTTKCFDTRLRLQLVKSYILPHLLYGDIVWFGLHKKYFNELRMLFHSCIRYVFRLRKYDHISSFTKLLTDCSLEELFEFRVCLYIFKFLKYLQPTYIISKLIKSTNRRNPLLIPARNKTRIMNSSFFVRGISMWNCLNVTIKSSKSPAVFRKKYFKNLKVYNI